MKFPKMIGFVVAGVTMLAAIPAQGRISAETGLKHSRTAKVTAVSHKKHKHKKHASKSSRKHHAKNTSHKAGAGRALHKTA